MIRKINDINLRNFTDATTYSNASILSTPEVKTASILIPANTFKAGDLISLESMFWKNNTTGTFTWKYYYNTSDSLVGATQLATFTSASNTIVFSHGYRRLSIIVANGGGSGIDLGSEILSTTQNISTDLTGGLGLTTMDNVAINWTANVYLICSLQNSTIGTTTSQRFFKVWTY